ncbi:hypothetical protein K7X08_030943 [Anisodus acutangulus]|uniref:Uncharacterized protein n=1 Tax=Anisodus acutangulus TaxID=402998 RepID=A0A9Q1MV47_9SOLA|nr:hypothetical protein K7X08_030943 [Anisodus acutangulus]
MPLMAKSQKCVGLTVVASPKEERSPFTRHQISHTPKIPGGRTSSQSFFRLPPHKAHQLCLDESICVPNFADYAEAQSRLSWPE